MKIDRISYQRVFAIGNYVTERIGLEASIDENDNPEVELSHLKQMVNELHSATIATLEENRGTKIRDVVEPIDKIQDLLQGALDEISKCETLEELGHLWLMSKGNLVLSQAWKVKEKQLKDAK